MLATIYRLTESEFRRVASGKYSEIDDVIDHLDDGRSLALNQHWELLSFLITSLPPVPHYLLGQDETLEDEALLGGQPTNWPNDAGPARVIAPSRVKEIAQALSQIPEKMDAYREGFVAFWEDVQEREYGYVDRDIRSPEEYVKLLEPMLMDLILFYKVAAESGDGILIYAQRSVDLA